ncbi:hypothetical protein AB0J42_29105 [Nonomuraea sp. NPDC049649]
MPEDFEREGRRQLVRVQSVIAKVRQARRELVRRLIGERSGWEDVLR